MCGIAGVVALGGGLPADSARVVEAMTGALRHRGPDGSGVWASDNAILGHRRLSIIDTSECGHQPMISRTGRFVVSFNGEIYNFTELAAEFRRDGWVPVGSSDTEVLLESVERRGLSATLDAIDGMFAFALVDRANGDVHLVRDRFGEKPLVHVTLGDRLWFASDITALSRVPGFDRTVSVDAVRDLLRHGYIDRHHSVFEGVEKIDPGHLLHVDPASGRRSSSRYWTVPRGDNVGASGHGPDHERLEELLTGSVRRRLHSDRPLGAFLSGGVDSALTCAIASEMVPRLDTFTMTWADREVDESAQAAAIAKRLGTSHHAVVLDESTIVDTVHHVAAMFDEPFADSSAIAVHAVSRFARETVVVCLSGDGGDELFGGYNRHRWLLRLRRQRRIPSALRRSTAFALQKGAGAAERLLGPLPTSRRPRLVRDKLTKLSRALASPDDVTAYLDVLAQSAVGAPSRSLPTEVAAALADGTEDDFFWAIRTADLVGYLPDDVLTKVDRATMSVGLECRTPFLEPEIAELAMGMGPATLLGRTGGKQPLRRILQRRLPEVSFDQPKSGFGVPVGRLLRGPLHEPLMEATSSFDARGFVPETSFHREATRMVAGDDVLVPALWAILMFELWSTAHAGSGAR